MSRICVYFNYFQNTSKPILVILAINTSHQPPVQKKYGHQCRASVTTTDLNYMKVSKNFQGIMLKTDEGEEEEEEGGQDKVCTGWMKSISKFDLYQLSRPQNWRRFCFFREFPADFPRKIRGLDF